MNNWPTVAEVIAHMREFGTIRAAAQPMALLLDESPTPLPEKLSMANILTLLAAEHATPSLLFAKAFRDAAISLAMGYELRQGSAVATDAYRPVGLGKANRVNGRW